MQKTETKLGSLDANLATQLRDKSEMVTAKMPQGYNATINVRLVPGRNLKIPSIRGCQPRQGAARREADPLPLPESLVDKLREADKRFVEWLAKDAANAHVFVEKPIEALLKAGIDLTREEQKTLIRGHVAASEGRLIPPGARVVAFSASAHPKGRVGEMKPSSKTKAPGETDCGCGPKGKE
jgi:hypothetical protein